MISLLGVVDIPTLREVVELMLEMVGETSIY